MTFSTHPAAERAYDRSAKGSSVIVFGLLALAFLILAWPTIQLAGQEWGDAAANAILVQDAKRLALTHGNYSRVGFHHPGPALLYMLAAGEWLFSDVLGWAAPIGGQLAAIAIYAAVWVALIHFLSSDFLHEGGERLLFTATFLGFLAVADREFVLGHWFPHLYILPFGAFTLACAVAASGGNRAIIPLALTIGVLVHGHVSFVLICGIMVLAALSTNLALARRLGEPHRLWFGPTFFPGNRSGLMIGVAIAAIFILPLAIETIRTFPGPIPRYWATPGLANPYRDAVVYVTQYFGGAVAMLALGAVYASAVWLSPTRSPLRKAGICLGAMAIAATIAAIIYARRGIDHLSLSYIAQFMIAVPALMTAFMAVVAASRLTMLPGLRLAAPVAALALAAGAVAALSRTSTKLHDIDAPATRAFADRIRQIPGQIRLHLADGTNPHVWGTVAGIVADQHRRRLDVLCVADWHVMYTERFRCPAGHAAPTTDVLLAATSSAAEAGVEPLLQQGGVTLYMLGTGRIAPGGRLDVAKMRSKAWVNLRMEGWGAAEQGFVWQTQPLARMTIPATHEVERLILDVGAFNPPGFAQTIEFRINGRRVATETFDAVHGRRRVVLPLPSREADGEVTLDISAPGATSPKALGLSVDARMLGAQLFGLAAE